MRTDTQQTDLVVAKRNLRIVQRYGLTKTSRGIAAYWLQRARHILSLSAYNRWYCKGEARQCVLIAREYRLGLRSVKP